MSAVRVGLVGACVMGSLHARALSAVREAKLVAIADRDEARARSLATDFEAAAYADYKEMLARESLDAVIVATSDGAHPDPCVAAGRHLCGGPVEGRA